MTRGSSTRSIGGIAGTEPVAMMTCSNCRVSSPPSASVTLQRVSVDDLGEALDVVDLAVLGELSGAGRQPLDDRVLEVAQLVEVDLRLAELDPHALA